MCDANAASLCVSLCQLIEKTMNTKEQPDTPLLEDSLREWRQWRVDNNHRHQSIVAHFNSAFEVARFCGRHRSPITDFTLADLNYYVSNKPIKYTTIRQNIGRFRGFYEWAADRGHVPSNIFRDYKVNPDGFRPDQLCRRPTKVFTRQQVLHLLEFARTTEKFSREWFYIVWLGYETGARIGDLVKLSKEYFDLETNTVMIRMSKTDEMFQTGEISQDLLDALMALPTWKEPYLFPYLQKLYTTQKNENVRASSYVYLQFKALCRAAGVPDIGTHALRKTFASLNYTSLKHIAEVQAKLGHKNPDTTGAYIANSKKAVGDKIIDFKEANAEYIKRQAKIISDHIPDRETR